MKTFEDLIGFIRKEVNKGIKNIPIPENPKYLYDPIRYSLKGNGKRFRPILTHLVGRANKIDPDVIMNISLSVELLHNFTLIHDDIMDKDSVRHGKKTNHEKWDKSSAILAGDGVYALSQIILSSVNNNVMSAYFNKTTLEICEGQALDKEFENNEKITESQYLEMIDKKTGALLSLSAILGPIYCGTDKEVISHYDDFGRNIGRGFQIHDDLLEITSNQDLMGKSLGSDLAEGKQTFMVIKARNLFPKKWKEIIIDSKSVDVVKNCKLFFDEKGIIEKTRIKAESYFESARENLKQIKSIDTGELLKFINLIEERTF
jgi:geranylgeranyl pyrophosphate synthase